MKRILIIAASLQVGGAEKVCRDIGLYGKPEEYEPHYVVFHKEVGAYEEQILAYGGKVFHLDNPALSYGRYLRSLRELIKKYRYHAVHAHTMFNCGWVMLAAKQMHVPVRIAHAHSALDTGNRWDKRLYEAFMRGMLLACATDLVACGEKAGIRLFGEKAYRQRAKLILNGVDVEAFRYDEQKRLSIRRQLGWENSFLIGHVGHLADVKNQGFLLELMPHILEKRPEARLLMLGEGSDRPMLEQKIRELGLEGKVLLPGNVTNVADYLSAMDVFAFPSLYEGMPLALLEVQANGLPCVISTGVPKDVYITDLICPLALKDERTLWVETICSARRNAPESYTEKMKAAGFDLSGAMEKIYRIYEG